MTCSSLQELAAASPEGDRVRFWGGVPPSRLVRFLQAADLFALLSLREGMPNALLEAMACGLPSVVTAVSGSAEVVRDGKSGQVVPIHDEEAAARAFAALLSDAGERSRLGSAAIETVREGYSLESVVDRWLEVYGSCAKGAGRRKLFERVSPRVTHPGSPTAPRAPCDAFFPRGPAKASSSAITGSTPPWTGWVSRSLRSGSRSICGT